MQAYTDVVLSRNKGAVQGATVTVRDDSGNLATIYSDDGVTQQVNPITTDLNGTFTFYAADGEYQLTVAGIGISTQTRFVLLQDFQNPAGSTVTLTDGATVSWDMKFGQIAFLTLSTTQATRTLANPTNIRQGAKGYLVVTQGSAGGQNISVYGNAFVPVSDLTVNPDAGSVTAFWFVSDGARLIIGKMGAAAAPSPAPGPGAPVIAIADEATDVLQVGNHIAHGNVWNAAGLTRGAYTGLAGTTYEQKIGVAYPPDGAGDPVAMRGQWKFPTGVTEVKSYWSVITGNFPGWFVNSPNVAGTWPLRLQDGTYNTTSPTGPTPNSIFPIALPITGTLNSTFAYEHHATPTGRGHLSYDIWLQSTPEQIHGFDAAGEITTEIMIPLDYWGGYGAFIAEGGGRNPNWYVEDVTIDGRLFHCFHAVPFDENNIQNNTFGSPWHFVVMEPDQPGTPPGTINLKNIINYVVSKGWANAVSGIVAAATHVVSVELGVETVDGTGDLTFYNYSVTNT